MARLLRMFRYRKAVSDQPPAPRPRSPHPPDGEFTVRVWVHERADGEQFVHPSMVMDMLRGLMKGSAASTFCDQFELALRRTLAEARANAHPGASLLRETEVATVGAEKESL